MAKLTITIEDAKDPGEVIVELRSDEDLMQRNLTQAQELALWALETINSVIDSSGDAVMVPDNSGQWH